MTRRRWIDPRLIIGSLLVIASIAGVWFVVQAASRSTSVWVAADTLLPGDTISAGDVVAAELRMEGATTLYLAADESPVGLVVATTVGRGEAIPLAAVGDEASASLASVVLGVEGGLPSDLAAGSAVTLWAAAPAEQGAFEAPSVLVDDAIVVGIVEDEGFIAADDMRVEVLVPRPAVAAVLDAIANAHAISVVPATMPVGSGP